ncbi:irregular chiasm C-roughest protein-like isoform X2 [Limulus polyphemus]|uniref:Irregular chiasm C-roughest protein-like isoform X2 n=1 Tax=Limulus polyphemus TaxID=6850 RepID=A0ABM1SW79_LIMPO|nr:irregular chiasm C-roughest protein-like isoform X2 [Limulus polyphemus]
MKGTERLNYLRGATCSALSTGREMNLHEKSWCLCSIFCLVHLFVYVNAQMSQGSTLDITQQSFAIEPADRTAIQGDTIVLPCRVLNKKGTLQWTRDGFGLGSERSLAGFPRYTMVGSDEEGDYSLQITNVSLEDDAVFQCQVGASDRVKGIRSRSADFTVYEPPRIVPNDFLETTAGMTVQLTCESNGGKPPAELAWLDGDGVVVTQGIEFTTQLLGDNKRANAALKWTFKASRKHDGKTCSCRSENPAIKQPMVATIKLTVKYPPEVTLTANRKKIMEFDDVQFTCDAVANPGDVTYKWYRNNQLVQQDHATTFRIPKVTRQLNRQTVSCEVGNKIGTTKSTYTLNIHYGPVFKSSLENIAADLNKEVRLVCPVDSNPPPKITWTFEKSTHVVGTDIVLVIPQVRPDRTGKYTCTASVPGLPELSSDSFVYIKGPPVIKGPDVQYGIEGQKVKVECLITSVPEPSRVVWMKRSQVVDIDNTEGYEIVTEHLPNGLKNLLIIHRAEETDFGDYNCSAWNALGHDSMLISVRRQTCNDVSGSVPSLLCSVTENLPMLIILAGVIGGIVLIVSVTIVIILCLRRKPDMKGDNFVSESKAKQSDSASSGDSDLKVEIRTASSLSNNEHERSWEETSDTTRVQDHPDIYKYTMDYAEPKFPPKLETQNNNGYVPYVDYSTDYNPSAVRLNSSRDSGLYDSSPQLLSELGHPLDPNFRTAYANPYMRTSQANLPPDHVLYGSTRGSSPTPQVLPSLPPNHYITSQQLPSQLKPGTLATHV